MKEKNAKNVSPGAGLAPPSRGWALQSLLGRARTDCWRARAEIPVRSPEEPMSGRETDGFLPSLPPQRVLFIFWSCVFCHPHDAAKRCSIHRQQSRVKCGGCAWAMLLFSSTLQGGIPHGSSTHSGMWKDSFISVFSPRV